MQPNEAAGLTSGNAELDAARLEKLLVDDHDHTESVVPQSERRGPITMGLLWITMVTAFPCVLIGFQWYKDGLTFGQVLSCTIISAVILLLYTIPSSQLGASSGQGYGMLSRSIFGRIGSQLITANLIWIFIAWYGLTALFMADGLQGLFHFTAPLWAVAAGFAILMACNNFFGFKGVANFARFFAAPVLIAWVLFTLVKAVGQFPVALTLEAPHKSFDFALTTVTSFVIGFAVWGNEADYWRFGKSGTKYCAIPLTVAVIIGQVVFPTAGWMVARLNHITESAAATSFMNDYSFSGVALVAAIVLAASYFACNDSNLFGQVHAWENLKKIPHKRLVAGLAVFGAATAAWLSISGTAKSLEVIASLNCVVVPTPTIIMLTEWFLASKILKSATNFSTRVTRLEDSPWVLWPGIIALVVGILVGVATAGVVPGLEFLHFGICSVQSWLAAIVVYVPLRLMEHARSAAEATDLERLLVEGQPAPERALVD